MAQDNWWQNDAPVGNAPAPQAPQAPRAPAPPPFIPGVVSPTKQAAEARAQAAEQRAQQDQALQMQKFNLDLNKEDRTAKKDAAGTVDEKKVATLTTRLAGAFSDINSVRKVDPSAQEPGIFESMRGGLSPSGMTGIVARKVAGPNRRMVYDAEMDALDALLTLGTGAAYTKEQLEGQRASYFPQYGDSKEEVAAKNQRLQRLIESAKANAGPAWANVEPQIAQFMGGIVAAEGNNTPDDGSNPPPAGGDPWTINNASTPETPPPVGDMSGMQQVATGATRNVGAPEIESRVNQMWLQGKSMDEINGFLSANGYEQVQVAPNAAEAKYWRRKGEGPFQLNRQVPNEGRARAAASPLGSYTAGAADAMTLGFSDELYGAANAATGGDYTQARDRFQGNKQAMAELNPYSSLAGTVSGALLTGPAGRVAGVAAPNATRAIGSAMAARPVAASAGMGAVYGAGSDNENRLRGAILGGLTGGLVGKGIQTVTPPITNALAARAAQRQASRVIPNAPEVAAAGQAEGVTVNRAMIDPRLENKVTGVDASLIGGPKLQAGMREIEDQIEGRVNALGRGGNAMEKTTAGQTIQAAGERFIKDSGKAASAKYTRAERLAGDAKVAPQQSLQAVDDALARLNETPSVNAAEISFLNSLKSDLSKDLSVGGLRRMRTSLRKKISNGGLVFGEDEARVLGIMDAAATDIRNGLQAQGKGKAAKAFDLADQEYRGRMEFINGTLQKVIGKRGSNLSAETVAKNLNGMLRGRDSEGARAFLSKLTPEEHADFGATLANSLGRSSPDEPFSVSTFLRHTKEDAFPLAALKVAFGDDGAQSIQNLRVLSKEVKRVTSAMNSRKSGSGVAIDYKSWLTNALLGLGGGAGTGSWTGAVVGTVAPTAIRAGRDAITARMLLNPKITRWAVNAPRTTNPAAINAHIGRLESMSRAGTIGRMDAQAIQDYLRAAVGQSPGRAAAEDEGD